IVAGLDETVARPRSTGRRQVAEHAIGEGEQADVIARASRDVGHHEVRVQSVIEMRKSVALGRHEAAAVEEAHDVLISLQLVVARDELVAARRRLPVDAAELVVFLVVAQALEFALATAHARANERGLAVLAREKLVGSDEGDVGVNLDRGASGNPELTNEEAERARVANEMVA